MPSKSALPAPVSSRCTASAAVAACAPKPEKIKPAYTPAVLYENLTCEQLAAEAENVSTRAHTAVGVQRKHRHHDQALVATGVVIFWPALFFTHSASGAAATADVAQVKGEIEAIEAASGKKGCKITFDRI